MDRKRGLWLIDAGYLFSRQRSVEPCYEVDYKKLREKVEADGPLWRAYYSNSTPNPPSDAEWFSLVVARSAPPNGPKIITKLYELKRIAVESRLLPVMYCGQ